VTAAATQGTATDVSPERFLELVGDPQRWHLLNELGRSDRRVNELTELVGKPQNLVSYHLAELRKAGLVSARRSSADGRDVYYRAQLTRCRDLFAIASSHLAPGLRLVPEAEATSGARRRRQPRVLFLCTGNSARSQMAEALLEHRSTNRVTARSAGSRPKPLHPHAVLVMADRGIDISHRKSKPLERFARTRFDRVITLCDKVREICPDFPGDPAAAHWSLADPAAEATLGAFERTADELEERIALLIPELAQVERTRHAH
jgi:ArsR family transcriptional regulator, arsenate/arsenite/antimonite-responsive transcriptional repressor / arsenate reductase (thioredoxin)